MGFQRTNIQLNSAKLEAAKRFTGLKTTKAVVNFALGRLSDSSRALATLTRLSGKIRFEKGYSYKKSR